MGSMAFSASSRGWFWCCAGGCRQMGWRTLGMSDFLIKTGPPDPGICQVLPEMLLRHRVHRAQLSHHHQHLIFIGYKIFFFGLSCPARKAWKPGQQCPVVCWEAGWWQHSGQECRPGSPSVPSLGTSRLSLTGAEDGLLLPCAPGLCLGRASPIKSSS